MKSITIDRRRPLRDEPTDAMERSVAEANPP